MQESTDPSSILSMDQVETPLMTEQEAADWLGYERQTLQMWRSVGKGPAYLKLRTGAIRYTQTDLQTWAFEHRVDPSASAVSD